MNSYAQVVIEHEENGHVFQFSMPFGCSYEAAKKAASQMVEHVAHMESEAQKLQENAAQKKQEGEVDGSE